MKNLLQISFALVFASAALLATAVADKAKGDSKTDEGEKVRYTLVKGDPKTKEFHVHRSGKEILRIRGNVQEMDGSKVKIKDIDDISVEFMVDGIVALTRKPGSTTGCQEMGVYFERNRSEKGQFIWIWAPSKDRFEYVEYHANGVKIYEGAELEAKRQQHISRYLPKKPKPKLKMKDKA